MILILSVLYCAISSADCGRHSATRIDIMLIVCDASRGVLAYELLIDSVIGFLDGLEREMELYGNEM